MQLTIKATGTRQAQQRITGVAKRAQRAKPALEAIAAYTLDVEKKQFTTGGKYGGAPWRPLSPRTIAKGRTQATILRDTGQLFRSLTTHPADGGRYSVTGTTMRVGSTLDKAENTQKGTRYRPRRRLIVWQRRETVAANKTITAWLTTGKLERPHVK